MAPAAATSHALSSSGSSPPKPTAATTAISHSQLKATARAKETTTAMMNSRPASRASGKNVAAAAPAPVKAVEENKATPLDETDKAVSDEAPISTPRSQQPQLPLSNSQGRVVAPELNKPTTALDALGGALSALGAGATALLAHGAERVRSGGSAAALAVPATSAAPSPASPAAGSVTSSVAAPALGDDALDLDALHLALPAQPAGTPERERVRWATWDRMGQETLLLLGYASGGMQVYALAQDGQLEERLDCRGILLPDEEPASTVLAAKAAPALASVMPATTTSKASGEKSSSRKLKAEALLKSASEDPKLVLVCAAEKGLMLCTYSLRSHTVLQAVPIVLPSGAVQPDATGTASGVMLAVSASFIVVAHASPPSLHVYEAGSLAALRVISTGAAWGRTPTFDLQERVLAYATSALPPNGPGIVTSPTPTRPSSHGVSEGLARARSVTVGGPRPLSDGASASAAAALEAGAQLSEHAKRIGGEVLGVAKTWSAAYWTGNNATAVAPTSPTHLRPESLRSANGAVPSLGARSPPSTLNSPVLAAAATTNTHPATGTSPSHAALPHPDSRSVAVLVLDLKASRTLAHFVPAAATSAGQAASVVTHASAPPITLVKLAQGADKVLTADAKGHAACVVEIRPAPLGGENEDAWLRYRLFRGHTTATLIGASWSADGAYVSLLSARGTAHTFALQPHTLQPRGPGPRRANPTYYAPLGTQLNAVARTGRAQLAPTPVAAATPSTGVEAAPLTPHSVVQEESLEPAALPVMALLEPGYAPGSSTLFEAPRSTPAAPRVALHLLLFEGTTASVALHRVTIAPASEGGVLGVGAATQTQQQAHPSGLTKMMRRAGAVGGGSGSGGAQSTSPTPSSAASAVATPVGPVRLAGACERVASWTELGRMHDSVDVRMAFDSTATAAPTLKVAKHTSRVGQAEISTNGGAPHIAPPIYLSRQVTFHTFETPIEGGPERREPRLADLQRAPTRRLVVRDEAKLVPSSSCDSNFSANASSGGVGGGDGSSAASSFDEGLASAMGARGFEPGEAALQARSPSSRIPAFPQGTRARQPSWTTRASSGIGAIPIRAGAVAVVGSLERARKGWISAQEQRRRSSAGTSAGNVVPTLSFDEAESDAAVFADAVKAAAKQGDSLGSRISASVSPSTRAGTATGPESGGSAGSVETPLTGASDSDEDEAPDEDEGVWNAARGTAEDEEGDSAGWDSFADREFGGRGATPALHWTSPRKAKAKKGGKVAGAKDQTVGGVAQLHAAPKSNEAAEDVIGVFDEDVAALPLPRSYASSGAATAREAGSAAGSLPGSNAASTTRPSVFTKPVATPSSLANGASKSSAAFKNTFSTSASSRTSAKSDTTSSIKPFKTSSSIATSKNANGATTATQPSSSSPTPPGAMPGYAAYSSSSGSGAGTQQKHSFATPAAARR